MDNRTSWILGTGVVGVAFVLFFIFVYQPKAREASQTTRMDELLRPSGRFYEQPLRFAPEFRYMSHTGDSIGLSDMRGKVFVVDFFFTNCTAACPMMSSNMTQVQRAMAEEPGFNIISFSLDPDKDSLAALQSYAEKFEALPGRWFFLTGPRESIYPLGEDGFMANLVFNADGSIDHSEKFILMDQQGGIRGYYQGTDPKEVEKLINDARYLLKHHEL